MPNVRDHDASVYLRLQGDALSVGGYEANPIFWDEVKWYLDNFLAVFLSVLQLMSDKVTFNVASFFGGVPSLLLCPAIGWPETRRHQILSENVKGIPVWLFDLPPVCVHDRLFELLLVLLSYQSNCLLELLSVLNPTDGRCLGLILISESPRPPITDVLTQIFADLSNHFEKR